MEQSRTNKKGCSIASMFVTSGMIALLTLSITAINFPTAAAQQGGTPGAAPAAASSSSNAACGQVVSGVVNLTANLNCSG
ncbi:MAG: hypothetical protein WCD28_07080, partial [Nitrososphaeraceae archaeon]